MSELTQAHRHTAANLHDREFWRGRLQAAKPTVPPWTLQPNAGIGEHVTPIPDLLVTALRDLADELSVPLSSVLLAAHAKVLGNLAGEPQVVTGYALPARAPLPLRIHIVAGSWFELVLAAARAESTLLSHRDYPVESLQRELGVLAPLFERVFDPTLDDRPMELGDGVVLWVGFARRRGFALKLRYRTDLIDAPCAARIAGRHLATLASMVAEPDAEHQSFNMGQKCHLQLPSGASAQLL